MPCSATSRAAPPRRPNTSSAASTSYLAWADALDRPDGYRPWRRPEPPPADRGAADAAFGLQHRAMAARSVRPLCAAHPGTGGARSAGGRARAPPIAAARCTTRSTSSWASIRQVCCRPAPSAEFEALGEKHLERAADGPGRARLLVAALPAPGALVHRHRERPAAQPARSCWRARPTAPDRRADAAGRSRSRRAPIASTRSSPAAGR